VTSNYSYESVGYTWELISHFEGGKALFTFPSTPIKCAGAPQKIMWLAEEAFRKRGVRGRSTITFASAVVAIFGVPKYRLALEKLVRERNIETSFKKDLIAVRPDAREAVFRDLDDGSESVLKYDLLHLTPPQSAPDFIKRSPLAQAGPLDWVDVIPSSTSATQTFSASVMLPACPAARRGPRSGSKLPSSRRTCSLIGKASRSPHRTTATRAVRS
jgi:sulfide:quinone oxidoreductase